MCDRNHFPRLELVRLDRRSRGLHHDLGRRHDLGLQRLVGWNLVARSVHVVDVEGAVGQIEHEFPLEDSTIADTVPGWDSLSHTRIITAVEAEYGIHFKTVEVIRLKNVGDL